MRTQKGTFVIQSLCPNPFQVWEQLLGSTRSAQQDAAGSFPRLSCWIPALIPGKETLPAPFSSLRSSGGFRDGSICCAVLTFVRLHLCSPTNVLHLSGMLTWNESGAAGVKLSCLVLAQDQAQTKAGMWFTCFVQLSEGWFVLEAHQAKFGELPRAQTVLGLFTSSADWNSAAPVI